MKRCWFRYLLLLPLLYGGLLHAQSIGIRLADTTVYKGTVFDLPIRVDSTFSGKEVYSYALQLQFDPRTLSLDTVLTTGTLTQGWGSPAWKVTRINDYSATLTIAAASSQPLSGDGLLLLLRFRSSPEGWGSRIQFGPAGTNVLNEGQPALKLNKSYSYVNVNNPPSLSLSPTTAVLAKGETLSFSAWGGTQPYTWLVSDTTLATISATGQLLALKEGQVVVTVIDTKDVRGTSGAITIRPYRLSVPNVEQWEGQVVDVPVLVSDLVGLNATSGRFQLAYTAQQLLYEGYRTTGLALQDYAVTVHQAEPGRLTVAFAGTQPLSGRDTLLTVSMRLLDVSWGAAFDVAQALFNEDLMGATTNGRVESKNNPYLSMSPMTGALVVGESVNMNLYGAVKPISWSVSDPQVAGINNQGVLTALKRGQLTVTAMDPTNATLTSNPFTVYDARVYMPDTSICEGVTELYWPVVMSNRPLSEEVYSFELSLQYDSAYLAFEGLVQPGTASEGWSAAVNNTYASGWRQSALTIACSGTTPVVGAGPLCYLKFTPKPALHVYTNTSVHISGLMLNEGTPTALVNSDASIQRVQPYEGSVSIYQDWVPRVCQGDTLLFNANVYNVQQPTYQWYINNLEVPGATMPHLLTSDLLNGDTVKCLVTALDPCILDPILWSQGLRVEVKTVPPAPDSITGDTLLVRGHSWTYYQVPYQDDVSRYAWSLPRGFSTPYGSNGNSIYVVLTDSATSGPVSVFYVNGCGAGDTTTLFVKVVDVPAKPDSIYGPSVLCRGVDSVAYWVTPQPGVTSYVWTLPWDFQGRSETNLIWVKPPAYETDGHIAVQASVAGIDGEPSSVSVAIESTPGNSQIYGPDRLTPGTDTVLFVCDAWKATAFEWVLPAGLNGASTTDSLYVSVLPSFTGGRLAVIPLNACGGGDTAWMNLGLTDIHDWYEIEGPNELCASGDSVCYRFGPHPAALYYQWRLDGLIGASTADSIWVKASGDQSFASISVVPILSGDTLEPWFKYLYVSAGKPAKPDTIHGPVLLERMQQRVEYWVPYDRNVSGYVWSFPEGCLGEGYGATAYMYVTEAALNGRMSVVPYNGCGFGDTVFLDVTFVPWKTDTIRGDTVVCAGSSYVYWVADQVDSTLYEWILPAGFDILGDATGPSVWITIADTAVSDTLRVFGHGEYGTGPVRSLFIQVLNGAPAAPGAIDVPAMVQRGQTGVTISVAPVPGATAYEWLLPYGFDGYSQTNTITVSVTDKATSDSVYVKAVGPCGYSRWVSAYLRVKAELKAPQIYGPYAVCAGQDSVLIEAEWIADATGYHWIISEGLTGDSELNFIFVSLSDTLTRFTVQAYAYNLTDSTDTTTLTIEVYPKVRKPVFLVAPKVLNPGMTDVAYVLQTDSTVHFWEWELPVGIIRQWDAWGPEPMYGPVMHKANDTLLVSVTDTAQSGWIKVFGYGFCGETPADSVYVTVEPVALPSIRTAVYTYPNPVRDVLRVRSSLLQEVTTKVFVYDLYGRQLDLPLVRHGDGCELTFSGQQSGLYVIILEAPDHTERVRVLKQ